MMQGKSYMLYATLMLFCVWEITLSDPGINLVGHGCGPASTNLSNVNENLNKTFGKIRTAINDGIHFVTANESSVYAMLQCREYMSKEDCLACFNTASVQIRNCSAATGARAIYDGCFFRYERTSDFYDESTRDGVNYPVCGNRTSPSVSAAAYETTVAKLAGDLRLATPKLKGYYAASKREVEGVRNASVYAIAQCVQTVDSVGCQACLDVAVRNIKTCLPNGEGRAIDSGCFMRYSDTPFFADNQTTNLESFNPNAGSREAPSGGVSGGGGMPTSGGVSAGGVFGSRGLIISLLVAFFAW